MASEQATPTERAEEEGDARLRRCLVLLNTAAGSYAAAEADLADLGARLERTGLEVVVERVQPEALDEMLDRELGDEPTLVVVGGGDGTLQSLTSRLADGPHVLGVLPLGTMNRFARSLGVPVTVPEAIEVLETGRDRPIDLGELQGMVFLMTCSLGLYPEITLMRERRRVRHQNWPNALRWLVDSMAAAWTVVRRWRLLRFRIEIDGETLAHRVPALLVVNDPIGPPEGGPADRPGVLGVYIPQVISRFGLFWLTLRSILFGSQRVEPLEVRMVDDAMLRVPDGTLVALDGEVVTLDSPLRLRSRPGACRVRLPVEEV